MIDIATPIKHARLVSGKLRRPEESHLRETRRRRLQGRDPIGVWKRVRIEQDQPIGLHILGQKIIAARKSQVFLGADKLDPVRQFVRDQALFSGRTIL